MRSNFRSIAGIVASLMLMYSACSNVQNSEDKNPIGINPTSSEQPAQKLGTYTVSGDSIFFISYETIDSANYCIGDSLYHYRDTIPSQTVVILFAISGAKLSLTPTGDVGLDTLGSGAIVTGKMTMARIGEGTGLLGDWQFSSVTYIPVAGTLTQFEKDSLDSVAAAMADLYRQWAGELRYDGNEISSSQFTDPANDYLSQWNTQWNLSGSTLYNITATKAGSTSVGLQGNRTNETVILTWNAIGDLSYSSSNPNHQTYTYYANPIQCPNDYEPGWFYNEFEHDNSRTGNLLQKATSHNAITRRSLIPGTSPCLNPFFIVFF
jgi:hypothetical protein